MFTADGSRVATASADGTARIWDAESGVVLALLREHGNAVDSIAFSPDGALVLTASADRTARLWNARTGALVAELRGHEGDVKTAAFSPDGARIVTASSDHTARLWNVASRQTVAVLEGAPYFCEFGGFRARRFARGHGLRRRYGAAVGRDNRRDLSPSERARYFLQERRTDGLSRLYDAVAPLIAPLLPHRGESCE